MSSRFFEGETVYFRPTLGLSDIRKGTVVRVTPFRYFIVVDRAGYELHWCFRWRASSRIVDIDMMRQAV